MVWTYAGNHNRARMRQHGELRIRDVELLQEFLEFVACHGFGDKSVSKAWVSVPVVIRVGVHPQAHDDQNKNETTYDAGCNLLPTKVLTVGVLLFVFSIMVCVLTEHGDKFISQKQPDLFEWLSCTGKLISRPRCLSKGM